MSGAHGSNVGGSGGSGVTVVGGSVGMAAYSASGRMGVSGCVVSEWLSDSSLRCVSSDGVGGRLDVVVSVGAQSGSGHGVVSYDAGAVSGGVGVNVARSGSVHVSVVGSGYGVEGVQCAWPCGWQCCCADGVGV